MSNFDKVTGTLVYVQVDKPVKAYVKPGAPKKSDEWKASVVLTDEDLVDELEAYGKELDTMLSIKKVKAVEFEDKYKCDLPEGAGKNVWVMTLRKSTMLGKTDKPVPDKFMPRVYKVTKDEEGAVTKTEITKTKLVGNGSKGTLTIDRFDRTSGGSSLYLKNVFVTDLIEYESEGSDYEPGSEYDGDTASDGNGGSTKVPAKAKAAAPAKPAAKAKPTPKPSEDDFDSDLPF
jgi:hypothetical protein